MPLGHKRGVQGSKRLIGRHRMAAAVWTPRTFIGSMDDTCPIASPAGGAAKPCRMVRFGVDHGRLQQLSKSTFPSYTKKTGASFATLACDTACYVGLRLRRLSGSESLTRCPKGLYFSRGRTRTCDLRVMSPTSCQLLYPASYNRNLNITRASVKGFSGRGGEQVRRPAR